MNISPRPKSLLTEALKNQPVCETIEHQAPPVREHIPANYQFSVVSSESAWAAQVMSDPAKHHPIAVKWAKKVLKYDTRSQSSHS
jgi:hypothetical protein